MQQTDPPVTPCIAVHGFGVRLWRHERQGDADRGQGGLPRSPRSGCELQRGADAIETQLYAQKHVCLEQVPCLLKLKHYPNVVFAGVDSPEDITGRTYQELFQTGGFIVSDNEVLEMVTLGESCCGLSLGCKHTVLAPGLVCWFADTFQKLAMSVLCSRFSGGNSSLLFDICRPHLDSAFGSGLPKTSKYSEGHQDDQGLEQGLYKDIQPGEGRAKGRPCCCLQLPNRKGQRKRSHAPPGDAG